MALILDHTDASHPMVLATVHRSLFARFIAVSIVLMVMSPHVETPAVTFGVCAGPSVAAADPADSSVSDVGVDLTLSVQEVPIVALAVVHVDDHRPAPVGLIARSLESDFYRSQRTIPRL